MKRVLLATAHQDPLLRQTSSEMEAALGFRFRIGDVYDGEDYIVVLDQIPRPLHTCLPAGCCIFVGWEPPSVHRYDHHFLSQFGVVVSCDRAIRHPNVLFSQLGLPWHIGRWREDGSPSPHPRSADFFRSFHPEKTKLLSVVCSDKAFTPQHRSRIAFVQSLQEHFGNDIDVFGRGTRPFGDKLSVLSQYQYHIALENCQCHDYWTEKLADPFLSLTYPIYFGAPNILEYFSADSMTRIDIQDPVNAFRLIRDAIATNKAQDAIEALRESREAVLSRHNLFYLVHRWIAQGGQGLGEPVANRPWRIMPERHFSAHRPLTSLLRLPSAALRRLRRSLPGRRS